MKDGLLFAYGTLQIPQVMEAVTGKACPSRKATAYGYSRYLIAGEVYPGMIPQNESVVDGCLYEGLEEKMWMLIDQFEDPVYQRESIEVYVESQGPVKAWAYVWPSQHKARLSDDPWEMDWFIRDHLPGYLTQCREFYLTMIAE